MGAIIAGLIGTAITAGVGIYQAHKQKKAQEEANENNIALNKEANNANIEMTDRINNANIEMTKATNIANKAMNDATNKSNIEQIKLANEANLQQVKLQNEANARIAKETNASNEKIAQENIAYQREALDYNKQLNNLQMAREDNALQRGVEDAKKAGLSALSATGAGASAGTPVSAINNNMKYEGYTAERANIEAAKLIANRSERANLQVAKSIAGHVEPVMAKSDIASQFANNMQELARNMLNIDKMKTDIQQNQFSNEMSLLANSRAEKQLEELMRHNRKTEDIQGWDEQLKKALINKLGIKTNEDGTLGGPASKVIDMAKKATAEAGEKLKETYETTKEKIDKTIKEGEKKTKGMPDKVFKTEFGKKLYNWTVGKFWK